MPKPIIIGQAPARGNDGLPPFAGKSGARLAKMAGVGESGDVLPKFFKLYNLIDYWPGPAEKGKGDNFPVEEALENAAKLHTKLRRLPMTYILMMGHRVTQYMGFGNAPYLTSLETMEHTWIPFPHPSGINRWYNDGANYNQARGVLRTVLALGDD